MCILILSDRRICETDNGGCLHTCVANTNGHFCVCDEGYELATDELSCVGKDYEFHCER